MAGRCALLVGIAALFLATGTAHADSASDITQKLTQLLRPGMVLQCGDLSISVRNGKLAVTGPEGAFKITADDSGI
jgi:hypothetical protein